MARFSTTTTGKANLLSGSDEECAIQVKSVDGDADS